MRPGPVGLRGALFAGLAGCQIAPPDMAADAAMAPPAPQFAYADQEQPEQVYRGVFRFGFELQSFEHCWIEIAPFLDHFELPPHGSGGVSVYEIEFIGARTDLIVPPGVEDVRNGFGHMGLSRCRFRVKELLSSRRVE